MKFAELDKYLKGDGGKWIFPEAVCRNLIIQAYTMSGLRNHGLGCGGVGLRRTLGSGQVALGVDGQDLHARGGDYALRRLLAGGEHEHDQEVAN